MVLCVHVDVHVGHFVFKNALQLYLFLLIHEYVYFVTD